MKKSKIFLRKKKTDNSLLPVDLPYKIVYKNKARNLYTKNKEH